MHSPTKQHTGADTTGTDTAGTDTAKAHCERFVTAEQRLTNVEPGEYGDLLPIVQQAKLISSTNRTVMQMHGGGVTSKIEYDQWTQYTVMSPVTLAAAQWAHEAAGVLGLRLERSEAASIGKLLVMRYSHCHVKSLFQNVMGQHNDTLSAILRAIGFTSRTIRDRDTNSGLIHLKNFRLTLQRVLIMLGTCDATIDGAMKIVDELL